MLLEEALAVDASDRAVSLCNLMLVHHLLGNDEQALKCASDAFDAASARGTGAYLWERDSDGTWAVVHVAPRDLDHPPGSVDRSQIGAAWALPRKPRRPQPIAFLRSFISKNR